MAAGDVLINFTEHSAFMQSADFSSDDSKAISASSDNTVKIWDSSTGNIELNFTEHNDAVMSGRFSSDDSKVISSSYDGIVKIWDAITGDVELNFTGHDDSVTSANFSHDDSKVISASSDNTVKIWDAITGDIDLNFTGHSDRVVSADFSKDKSKAISTAGDETVKIWDTGFDYANKGTRISDSYIDYINSSFSKNIVEELSSIVNNVKSNANRKRHKTIYIDSYANVYSGIGRLVKPSTYFKKISSKKIATNPVVVNSCVNNIQTKINMETGITRVVVANSYVNEIKDISPENPKYAKRVTSYVNGAESVISKNVVITRFSWLNIAQSDVKKHHERDASTVTAIFSSAEIGPVTKAAISIISINSDIAKIAKLTSDSSYFRKILTDVLASNVNPNDLKRLPDNYNKKVKSNNWKLITVIQDEISKIKQAIRKISKAQDIDRAYGEFLDRHGENLQLKRGNKTDSIYRITLKAKMQRNISKGSINEIIEIIATMLNISVREVKIEENPGNEPASMYIGVPISPLAKFGLSYDRFADIVDGILAGGVTLYSLTQGTYTYGDIDYEYSEKEGLADATDHDRKIGGYFGAWAERGI